MVCERYIQSHPCRGQGRTGQAHTYTQTDNALTFTNRSSAACDLKDRQGGRWVERGTYSVARAEGKEGLRNVQEALRCKQLRIFPAVKERRRAGKGGCFPVPTGSKSSKDARKWNVSEGKRPSNSQRVTASAAWSSCLRLSFPVLQKKVHKQARQNGKRKR